MEQLVTDFAANLHIVPLVGLVMLCLGLLGWSADKLVNEAVTLSRKSGIPKTVVGATIVSLGTTAPEAAVSVWAALDGAPDLALGNAVGSIICDTGLILGIATLICPLKIDRAIVSRQGWLQLMAGTLLVLACMPWSSLGTTLTTGGNLSQLGGAAFVVLLALYLWGSTKWTAGSLSEEATDDDEDHAPVVLPLVILKLVLAIAGVVLSAQVLIPAVQELAIRAGVPTAVIAVSLVAFGTSLPELVTAVTAARRGHGELAIGNVVGADILNVLFVAGVAAVVTPSGLDTSPHFFRILFPAMMCILIVFRVGVMASKEHLKFGQVGWILLLGFVVATILNFTLAPEEVLNSH
ncbi:MAG: sodium:calcium antiporter [Planctomycetota bacterium]|nr:sodium:calcium antiporter [Planctomycetota bacterium]